MIQRTCVNHPQRKAIGVCVMTGKAICAECSTRHEGVNYSKEGLAMRLAQQRDAEQGGRGARVGAMVALLFSPAMLAAAYGMYWYTFRLMIDLQQWSGPFSNLD
jgi:hypothetical protein